MMIAYLCLLASCVLAEPLPLIDPEFSDGLDTWAVSTPEQIDSFLLEDGEGSPDTTDGQCLQLSSGTSIETRAPILRSMKAGQSLHVVVSLKGDLPDSPVRFALVEPSGAIHCGDEISASETWNRYRVALMSKVDASGPLRLRIIQPGTSDGILLDNLSLELIDPAGDDFESLFNGETLEGWIGDTDGYSVEEGVLRVAPGTGGDIRTKSEFSDFQLRFDFLLSPGSNNGIAVRAPLEGNAAYEGMEIQVLDNLSESHSKLKPWQYHGSAYGIIPAKRGWMLPPGQWNRQEIRLVGRRLTVTLNGHVILDADLDEALKDGPVSGAEHPGAARTSGHVGFCGYGSEVSFRNIRIRPVMKRNQGTQNGVKSR